MIRAGLGIALLPQNAVALFRDPQITFRRIDGLELWRVLYLLQSAQRTLSGAARAFVDMLWLFDLRAMIQRRPCVRPFWVPGLWPGWKRRVRFKAPGRT